MLTQLEAQYMEYIVMITETVISPEVLFKQRFLGSRVRRSATVSPLHRSLAPHSGAFSA